MKDIRPITEIAATSINFRCPHCNTVMSMGSDGHRIGEPFQCFCERWVVIPHDVEIRVPQLRTTITPSRVVSLNSAVMFKLTQDGRRLFKTLARAEVQGTKLQPRQIVTDNDGRMEMPMWEFMNFFGPSLHHGMTEIIFEERSINIGK
ncbi:putative RimK-related lysine biosynthesis protein [Pseudomonas phage PaBG]|uniref:Uncharacterized protein n=1 Tax=Pseudomonas phage PaBG TaxID=1335230 RepID=S5WK73_9CAUD|nr:putative RimK-related lysine biosynthesis protein [Pseudomonas phage PaBG]AGS81921.1 putative RimK-related lysine biosynthesis protein [Pseudomonas phage PaBG]